LQFSQNLSPPPITNTMTTPNPSLDNATVWDYKPWWCQPWSILLTGNGAIGLSWLFFHRYWVTGLIAIPLVAWMGFFLIAFPKIARDSGMLAEMHQAKAATINPPD
jgi:hypothetical protein